MHHHICRRKYGLRRIVACIVQLHVACETGICIVLSVRPEHAAGRLVSDLDPFWRDAGRFQRIEHVRSMVRHRLFQSFEIKVLPCLRLVLLAGIRPPVAVMEVDHHPQAQVTSSFGLGHHIVLSAPAVLRVHPHAQAYRIDSIAFKQRHAFALRAVRLVELAAFFLHLCHPADIGAFHVIAVWIDDGVDDGVVWTVLFATRGGEGQHGDHKGEDAFHRRVKTDINVYKRLKTFKVSKKIKKRRRHRPEDGPMRRSRRRS